MTRKTVGSRECKRALSSRPIRSLPDPADGEVCILFLILNVLLRGYEAYALYARDRAAVPHEFRDFLLVAELYRIRVLELPPVVSRGDVQECRGLEVAAERGFDAGLGLAGVRRNGKVQNVVKAPERAEFDSREKRDDGNEGDREKARDEVILGADRHTGDERPEDEGDVAGVLDRGAKADDGEGAEKRKGPHDVGADDHHRRGGKHGQDDEREYKGLGIGKPAMSALVNPGDEQGQAEANDEIHRHRQGGDVEHRRT